MPVEQGCPYSDTWWCRTVSPLSPAVNIGVRRVGGTCSYACQHLASWGSCPPETEDWEAVLNLSCLCFRASEIQPCGSLSPSLSDSVPQPRFYCILSPEASEDDLNRLDSTVLPASPVPHPAFAGPLLHWARRCLVQSCWVSARGAGISALRG